MPSLLLLFRLRILAALSLVTVAMVTAVRTSPRASLALAGTLTPLSRVLLTVVSLLASMGSPLLMALPALLMAAALVLPVLVMRPSELARLLMNLLSRLHHPSLPALQLRPAWFGRHVDSTLMDPARWASLASVSPSAVGALSCQGERVDQLVLLFASWGGGLGGGAAACSP